MRWRSAVTLLALKLFLQGGQRREGRIRIGATLGARFAGRGTEVLTKGLRIAALTVATTMALGILFALTLFRVVGETWQAVLLAYAPGGLVEMSLVALSLEISVIYVTLHHVVRIILAVIVAAVSSSGGGGGGVGGGGGRYLRSEPYPERQKQLPQPQNQSPNPNSLCGGAPSAPPDGAAGADPAGSADPPRVAV